MQAPFVITGVIVNSKGYNQFNAPPRLAVIQGNIAKIPIGSGGKDGFAIVDVEFAWLDKYRWFKHTNGYAICNRKPKYMHRFILPDASEVDHISRDKLDNRKVNLRSVTHSENGLNRGMRSDNKTGAKGIHFDHTRGKWMAQVCRGGKRVFVKRYDTLEEAIDARAEFVKEFDLLQRGI